MKSQRPHRSLSLPSLLSVVLAMVALPWSAQAYSDPSLLPDGRQREELRPAERNPFAQQASTDTTPKATEDRVTEESRIRRIVKAMKFNGVSGSPGNKRVLLGPLILKPGSVLPPLLTNQFEVLKVQEIDDAAVILAFVERDPTIDARQIVLPFAMQPTVSQAMVGEVFENLTAMGPKGEMKIPPLDHPGIAELQDASKEANLENVLNRDTNMMGVTTHGQKSPDDK